MKEFLLLLIFHPILTQDISPLIDIKTLSELPLEKLLQVKQSFGANNIEEIENVNQKLENLDEPQALPLKLASKFRPYDRGGYHSYEYGNSYYKKGKKSIQSIFQISVTTLAFLAFGGYLVCLLCQAIRGSNMTDTTNTAIMAALLRPTTIQRRRRRTTRRPIRLQNRPNNGNRRRPRPRPKRNVEWTDLQTENMYYTLIHLSEGYANYHTLNYQYVNSSIYDFL